MSLIEISIYGFLAIVVFALAIIVTRSEINDAISTLLSDHPDKDTEEK